MRLERLEVTGFGRLSQSRFDFAPRITVVLGPNESGKSTLHRALRAALYGLEAGGPGRPRERSDWARWAPWSGGRYGLALTYRLDSGTRYRVAQSFDRGRITAQVQELGGPDVTQLFRVGRSVSPGRVHLGVDEPVFCAAGWLGDEGLRLAAPDAPPAQAGHLREALERLVDTGPEGVTAARAVERLEDALRRVGSERRSGTPLGVATAQARRLEAEIDAGRRRLSAFAGEQERLRGLEAEAAAATAQASQAQRAWLAARLAQLGAEEREAAATAEEVSTLTTALSTLAAWSDFPVHDEAQVIALGGELHQAEQAAESAEGRADAAAEPLPELGRRREEIAAGLRALPATNPPDAAVGERAAELRRRVAVSEALAQWGDQLTAATARDQALRREIAGTGLGAIDDAELSRVARLALTVRTGQRLRRLLGWWAGSAVVVALAGASALALSGHTAAGLAVAALLVLLLGGLAVAAWVGSARARAAGRELSRRLPGLEPGPASLAKLIEGLPTARRLHREREQQAALVDAGRDELERAREELEALADACAALASEAGAQTAQRPGRGSAAHLLLHFSSAALTAVEESLRRSGRRQELDGEDARLAAQEEQIVALRLEARQRREAAAAVEARIRRITTPAGVDPGLPPLAAVAAFRDACEHRREHDRLTARLGEAQRRQGMQPGDATLWARHREELEAELRRCGGDPATSEPGCSPPGAAELADLERAARSAQARAIAAAGASDTLRARLEGMTDTLPALADLEDERLAVSAARERALRQQAALERAVEMIGAAGREVHGRVAPRLAAAVSERLASLTDNRYREANVDIEHFAVALTSAERDQLVPLELVSHGTRDQVSLLLRLALCELLGDAGEAMPLLLDEPAASSDPRRRASLGRFMSQLSLTNQLVVTASDPGLAASLVALNDPADVSVIDLESGALISGVPAGAG